MVRITTLDLLQDHIHQTTLEPEDQGLRLCPEITLLCPTVIVKGMATQDVSSVGSVIHGSLVSSLTFLYPMLLQGDGSVCVCSRAERSDLWVGPVKVFPYRVEMECIVHQTVHLTHVVSMEVVTAEDIETRLESTWSSENALNLKKKLDFLNFDHWT